MAMKERSAVGGGAGAADEGAGFATTGGASCTKRFSVGATAGTGGGTLAVAAKGSFTGGTEAAGGGTGAGVSAPKSNKSITGVGAGAGVGVGTGAGGAAATV